MITYLTNKHVMCDLFLRFLNKHKVIVNLCSTALYCLHLPLLTKDIFVDLPVRQSFKLLTGRVGDLRSRIINVVYIRFLLHCALLFSNKSSTCFHCHIGCRRSVDSRRGRSSGPNWVYVRFLEILIDFMSSHTTQYGPTPDKRES